MTGSDESGQAGASEPAMSPAQSRAARGLLGWSEAALAAKVGLDAQFVRDFESGYGDPPSGQLEALRSALCTAGAVFDDAPNPGVHLAAQANADEGVRLGALTTENDR
ncbi:multiprotein-bridging factor 1 family protein [Methylobacterium sp. J-077]|uniref:helix-turn-helix domain-containing protein n=1 Tax=Methylobacterium sp. J-077 TaxID=2836656 RepID=UPI001FB90201|nr:helix-turn-helix transcriptional regulator [Methylobacterium sp. J-077]MCJ2122998.1 helix-turn-helix domain-containing protein [Methylobacterium sp. J-077]